MLSASDANAALAANDLDRLWTAIQSLLVGAANTSKLLWGTGWSAKQRKEVAERRRSLREALGVSDESPLASRDLRNHFEHFDERIERWADEDPHRNLVDTNVGSIGTIPGVDPRQLMRHFDPSTATVYFRGEAFELQPIVTAADEIAAAADRELHGETIT